MWKRTWNHQSYNMVVPYLACFSWGLKNFLLSLCSKVIAIKLGPCSYLPQVREKWGENNGEIWIEHKQEHCSHHSYHNLPFSLLKNLVQTKNMNIFTWMEFYHRQFMDKYLQHWEQGTNEAHILPFTTIMMSLYHYSKPVLLDPSGLYLYKHTWA